jgi:adenylate cyclase
MSYLLAQGPQLENRWRRALPESDAVLLGRSTAHWQVTWDARISRQHVELQRTESGLCVRKLEHAGNPVFHNGAPQHELLLQPGEHFVIGETTFTYTESEVIATLDHSTPAIEQTFLLDDLQHVQFDKTPQRIDLLSQLPDLISNAGDDHELFSKLVTWLMLGIPRAAGIAFVSWKADQQIPPGVEVLYWDNRGTKRDDFTPSQQLIQQTIEADVSTLHFWNQDSESEFTELQGIDWAFCIPVGGSSCPGWGLYIAGRSESNVAMPEDSEQQLNIKIDMKYAQLAASTLGKLRTLKFLQHTETHFRQFFPDFVVDALQSTTPEELLSPRECEVSVLFCDLRGFARTSEQSQHDLMHLLQVTSQSLSVMTRQILDHHGVIGDFHGDAAMGFWGWPVATDDGSEALHACQAALAITTVFAEQAEPTRATIGIASGLAVAGQIGSDDQVKVSVLGPVVNLAARLESMNRQFNTMILVDEVTAQVVERSKLPLSTVKLATVRPQGMETDTSIYMLLSSAEWQNNIEFYGRYSVALKTIENGELLAGQASLEALLTDYPTQASFAQLVLEQISQQSSHVIHLQDK